MTTENDTLQETVGPKVEEHFINQLFVTFGLQCKRSWEMSDLMTAGIIS